MITEILRNAPYASTLRLQRERFDALVNDSRLNCRTSPEWLMLVEHTSVYTLGRHGNPANLIAPERLVAEGIDLVEIDRGGDITYHGPGQLVAYPLIDLQRRHLGVKAYVNLLEQAVIDTIAEYGIKGERLDGATGVWIEPGTSRARKICAIGIRCSRFITMHGLALNVSTDLRRFNAINPCGFTDRGVTSISAEIGSDVYWADAASRLEANLRKLLDAPGGSDEIYEFLLQARRKQQ